MSEAEWPETSSEAINWAQNAAREIIENHGDSAAIDTGNYRECSFIMSAVNLALSDVDVAERIGRMMEPPRIMDKP